MVAPVEQGQNTKEGASSQKLGTRKVLSDHDASSLREQLCKVANKKGVSQA